MNERMDSMCDEVRCVLMSDEVGRGVMRLGEGLLNITR